MVEIVSRWEVESDGLVRIFQDSHTESGPLFHPCAKCIVRYHDCDHNKIDNTSSYHGSSMVLSSVRDDEDTFLLDLY